MAGCSSTVSNSCSFDYTVDGIDSGTGSTNSGNLTIQSGGTVTVGFNQTIAVGKLTLAGGSIAIIDGGKILLGTPLWVPDNDSNGHPDSLSFVASTNQPDTHYRRVNLMSQTTTVDCDPYNANVFPGQTTFFTTAIVDVGGTSAKNGTYDYNCDGTNEKQNTTSAVYSCVTTGCAAHYYTVSTGWATSNPACGATAAYRTRTVAGTCASTSCSYTTQNITQACR